MWYVLQWEGQNLRKRYRSKRLSVCRINRIWCWVIYTRWERESKSFLTCTLDEWFAHFKSHLQIRFGALTIQFLTGEGLGAVGYVEEGDGSGVKREIKQCVTDSVTVWLLRAFHVFKYVCELWLSKTGFFLAALFQTCTSSEQKISQD